MPSTRRSEVVGPRPMRSPFHRSILLLLYLSADTPRRGTSGALSMRPPISPATHAMVTVRLAFRPSSLLVTSPLSPGRYASSSIEQAPVQEVEQPTSTEELRL